MSETLQGVANGETQQCPALGRLLKGETLSPSHKSSATNSIVLRGGRFTFAPDLGQTGIFSPLEGFRRGTQPLPHVFEEIRSIAKKQHVYVSRLSRYPDRPMRKFSRETLVLS
jgi:hypothetical protein